jgi:uncharacterized protein (DUF1330 family)
MSETGVEGKAVFMIAAVNVLEPEKMGPYMEACNPLFAEAGIELIAVGAAGCTVQVLEGSWPHEGALMLYKGPSMDALTSFWNSPEYQDAIKLREGIVQSHFTVAIEETSA